MSMKIKILQGAIVIAVAFMFNNLLAQQEESPVQHMNQIVEIDNQLQKKYLSYMSTIAHTNSARKMEKRREELILSIQESSREVSRIRLYKQDASLRNTYNEFLKILLTVFKEDYHKIVNMEEIAEQSYDNMEAYLLAQERANEKLNEAASKIEPAYNEFAARHNVTLKDSQKESEVSRKLRVTSEVNEYYHQLFLIFFKCHHQEGYLLQALGKNDVNAVEQNRNTLIKYAKEGLSKLDTTKTFKGDGSLLNNCRRMLMFYETEASTKLPVMTEFLVKKDEFEKIRRAFEAKSQKQRTQADIDKYNQALEEMNAKVDQFNKTNDGLNKERSKYLEGWNNSVKQFLDNHVPSA